MPVLINAYSTCRHPLEPTFPYSRYSRRERNDEELPGHLNGFIGFILQRGERPMTTSLYHVMRHLERVHVHFSFDIEEEDSEAFSDWARQANAVLFLTDGTVRDPEFRVLVHPETGAAEAGADVPYPPDAIARKARNDALLAAAGSPVLSTLPPVVGEDEVILRPAGDVMLRAYALFATAVRAETLAAEDPWDAAEMQTRLPIAFPALSPKEREFMHETSPSRQDVINSLWRYEALDALLWALGQMGSMDPPTTICNVKQIAGLLWSARGDEMIAAANLRPTSQILDALDLHYRLHWAARDTRSAQGNPPLPWEAGAIAERHYALNWLCGFEQADWDDVTTPT